MNSAMGPAKKKRNLLKHKHSRYTNAPLLEFVFL